MDVLPRGAVNSYGVPLFDLSHFPGWAGDNSTLDCSSQDNGLSRLTMFSL